MPSSPERFPTSSRRRILVTGAAGFVGAHLVRRLLHLGHEVVAVTRPNSDLWRLGNILDWIEVVSADVAQVDTQGMRSALRNVELVYHLAAAGVDPSRGSPAEVVETNVVGTLRMLELARDLEVDRFLYCGSCFEYGPGSLLAEDALPRPVSEYGASKTAGWTLAHAFGRRHGLAVVSLRPFTVYGPLEAAYRLVPSVALRGLDGSTIEVTGGKQTRDFVFIEDVVDGFVAAAAVPEAVDGTFNLCTGKETSVRELVTSLVGLTGKTASVAYGARPYRESELWQLSGDPSKAQEVLGWTAATDLSGGLEKTVDWLREHRFEYAEYAREAARL